MNPTRITEEDKVHPAWYEEARTVTLDTLPEFVRKLVGDYEHDYGTICHAMGAAMTAAMSAVDKSSQGGITGFQAGCVMWCVLEHAFHEKGPMRLVNYRDLLYPQYAKKFTTITPETWAVIRAEAQKLLAEDNKHMHENVRAHMEGIAEHGKVPFGLSIGDS